MPETYSNPCVAAVVENEGLAYAVLDYMSADVIEDPKMALLWAKAEAALVELETYLSQFDPEAC